ncbi:DUF3168 domain-containing protein [Sutcliffiella horikoshii]|uniref:DUF3168 domain-containing protein n=1 Tax=Sutcliffiella horikoshii TaxID=79883 RepID=UPI002040ED3D|nr:DUF3168 domain-containing protein [Sutcliffiella horikoshii]
MSILYSVQESVYQRLDSDEELAQKIVGIYDYVPEETDFPYVILGRVFSTPHKTKTTDGENVEITLDIWSTDKGKEETAKIMKQIEASLAEELSVGDAFLVSQDVKSREIMQEANDLYRGTLVYEIIVDTECDY